MGEDLDKYVHQEVYTADHTVFLLEEVIIVISNEERNLLIKSDITSQLKNNLIKLDLVINIKFFIIPLHTNHQLTKYHLIHNQILHS